MITQRAADPGPVALGEFPAATEQMIFKRKGEVVARVFRDHVVAWWVEEEEE